MSMFPALTDLPLDPIIATHPAATRVYLRLLALLDFSEVRAVKAWALADELFVQKATVIQAFQVLVDRGFLIDQGRSVNNVRLFTLAWSRPAGSKPERPANAA